jgi:hypothetical protein
VVASIFRRHTNLITATTFQMSFHLSLESFYYSSKQWPPISPGDAISSNVESQLYSKLSSQPAGSPKSRRHFISFRSLTRQSHILCLPCAEKTGLSAPNEGVRVCPACGVRLMNQDDAVITQLDPSEDYKTSVLSGLTPTIIMECAGRGLSFYSYQVNQEMSALWVLHKISC